MTKCIDGVWCYQHRVVMEELLGRKLSRDEDVHHIDDNKLNNDITNLKLIKSSEHHKQHLTSDRAKEMSIKGHKARWGRG